MSREKKRLLKTAVAIYARLGKESCPWLPWLPDTAWEKAQHFQRQIARAEGRGWHLAAERLRRGFLHQARCIETSLQSWKMQVESVETDAANSPKISVRDIYHDLAALYDEFDDVSFDRRRTQISVITEPITLDGVYLGPFEIQLDWGGLPCDHNYLAIATDPHPAATNSSVTHPHVQDELVCAGEAKQPIRSALREGRLLDFFLIVVNTLGTYNPGSPYVALEDWYKATCDDCGEVIRIDAEEVCEACEAVICGGCCVTCDGCKDTFCDKCLAHCRDCGDYYCAVGDNACLARCANCNEARCRQNCLDDKERCTNCHEEEQEAKQEADGELVATTGG
jgi:hypothetical protein